MLPADLTARLTARFPTSLPGRRRRAHAPPNPTLSWRAGRLRAQRGDVQHAGGRVRQDGQLGDGGQGAGRHARPGAPPPAPMRAARSGLLRPAPACRAGCLPMRAERRLRACGCCAEPRSSAGGWPARVWMHAGMHCSCLPSLRQAAERLVDECGARQVTRWPLCLRGAAAAAHMQQASQALTYPARACVGQGVDPVLRTYNTLIIACNMCCQPREVLPRLLLTRPCAHRAVASAAAHLLPEPHGPPAQRLDNI
jgi:hypothetical protein